MPIFAYLYRYNTQRNAPDSTDNTIQGSVIILGDLTICHKSVSLRYAT